MATLHGSILEVTKVDQGAGCPVHTFSARFRVPPTPPRNYPIPQLAESRASGRGWSDADGRSSCIHEALERYSAFQRAGDALVPARYAQLGQIAVHPNLLLQFSPRQYEQRSTWNAAFGSCQHVPDPYCEEDEIEWVECRSFIDTPKRMVPAGACYLRYAPPQPRIIFPNESTGCSAGPSLDEATVRGALEVVERDAVALWWYNRCSMRSFDLSIFGSERTASAADYLALHGRSLHVLDLTTDFSIPVAAAVSATHQGDGILFGFAAEFDPRLAVERAVAELVQILGPLATWTREAMLCLDSLLPDRRAWVQHATLANQPYVLPSAHPSRTPGDFAPPPSQGNRLNRCVQVFESLNQPLLALDLSRPPDGPSVIRVLAPGMRSSWARFGPGRLYETPVKLGWRTAACRENRLNTFPFFL